jgi:flagellar biosynthesis chaperone FliJ
MCAIPLREENIKQDLVAVMKSNSIENLNNFIQKYTIIDIDSQLDAQNWPKNYKNMKTCIELYMSETDPGTAFKVLRSYIFREFVSQEAHDSYVVWVKGLTSEMRKEVLGGYHFNAIDI